MRSLCRVFIEPALAGWPSRESHQGGCINNIIFPNKQFNYLANS